MAVRNIKVDIIALNQQGFSQAEIARRLGCTRSYVHQVLSFHGVLLPTQAGKAERHKSRVSPDTCQRPDARKNFKTCGEPKKVTACGERLGVCEYHWNATMPLGGAKL